MVFGGLFGGEGDGGTIYFCAHIQLMFKHTVLGSHLRYLGSLSRTDMLVVVFSVLAIKKRWSGLTVTPTH